jgi:hypothetical protein
MIWTIDTDDFLPECSNVKFPLLGAIHSEFKAAYIYEQKGDKMRSHSFYMPGYAVEFPTLNSKLFPIYIIIPPFLCLNATKT